VANRLKYFDLSGAFRLQDEQVFEVPFLWLFNMSILTSQKCCITGSEWNANAIKNG